MYNDSLYKLLHFVKKQSPLLDAYWGLCYVRLSDGKNPEDCMYARTAKNKSLESEIPQLIHLCEEFLNEYKKQQS